MEAIKENILHVQKNVSIPINHIKYLEQLKNSGFEPKVIYDIGSCCLHWTREARRLWTDAKFILFDAFEHVEFLYKDYDYHIGVLGNEDGKVVKFYQNNYWFGGNSYYKENNDVIFPEKQFVMKTMSTLDTVVHKNNFPYPDLIKIDTQGAERDIIAGGLSCLGHASRLIVEMQDIDYNIGAPKVDITLPYIETLGWKCDAPKFSDNGADADYGFVRV
jgi:FkbM family methyltransferase